MMGTDQTGCPSLALATARMSARGGWGAGEGGGNPVLAQGRGGRTLGFITENPIKMDDLLL